LSEKNRAAPALPKQGTRIYMKLLLISLLLTLSISAAGFDGKWIGSFTDSAGGTAPDPFFLVLKQDGKALTGTAGPKAEEQMPISNGKLDGDTVTFDLDAGGFSMHFTLALADEHLKGEVKAKAKAEGVNEQHSAKVDVTRVE
jgi:hypothetical protein